MYYLKTPIDLTEEEYSWIADLKKSMAAYMDTFGVAELRSLVKSVVEKMS